MVRGIEENELNSFEFILYDKNRDKVCFEVAWIKIDEYPTIEYEGAIGFWLC